MKLYKWLPFHQITYSKYKFRHSLHAPLAPKVTYPTDTTMHLVLFLTYHANLVWFNVRENNQHEAWDFGNLLSIDNADHKGRGCIYTYIGVNEQAQIVGK